MPDPLRAYFDSLNPTRVYPGEGRLGGPRQADLPIAWNRLARTLGVDMPRALDRCRDFRNRFTTVVRP